MLRPWPLSIRIFMVLSGDSSGSPLKMPGRAGHDGAKVIKSGNSVMELPREIVT